MSDINRVKETIRKLMAYADDGNATEAEITNALTRAAGLIDKHHLQGHDFTPKEREDEAKMGRASGSTESSKFHKWETTLAAAIEKLFGCVKHYLDSHQYPWRINGVAQVYTGKYAGQVKKIRKISFYGPAVEASEAAELFTEWNHLIASMGVIRWGGAYRGDGEMYCQGFADSLWGAAHQLNNARALVPAQPLAALPGEAPQGTAIMLSDRYQLLQARAAEWLEKDQGIKLSNGGGRQGSRSGSSGAYREGQEHGSQAGFGRGGARKRLE